jgi:hypothetical protein
MGRLRDEPAGLAANTRTLAARGNEDDFLDQGLVWYPG